MQNYILSLFSVTAMRSRMGYIGALCATGGIFMVTHSK